MTLSLADVIYSNKYLLYLDEELVFFTWVWINSNFPNKELFFIQNYTIASKEKKIAFSW